MKRILLWQCPLKWDTMCFVSLGLCYYEYVVCTVCTCGWRKQFKLMRACFVCMDVLLSVWVRVCVCVCVCGGRCEDVVCVYHTLRLQHFNTWYTEGVGICSQLANFLTPSSYTSVSHSLSPSISVCVSLSVCLCLSLSSPLSACTHIQTHNHWLMMYIILIKEGISQSPYLNSNNS